MKEIATVAALARNDSRVSGPVSRTVLDVGEIPVFAGMTNGNAGCAKRSVLGGDGCDGGVDRDFGNCSLGGGGVALGRVGRVGGR